MMTYDDTADLEELGDFPDEEGVFLEEMGFGGDGEGLTLADTAWTGEQWEPDVEQGVF